VNGNVSVAAAGLKVLSLDGNNTGSNVLASSLTNGTGTLGLSKVTAQEEIR
jgi:hypothetical protein